MTWPCKCPLSASYDEVKHNKESQIWQWSVKYEGVHIKLKPSDDNHHRILEHLYIHKQILSQSCIHICLLRQVFPLTAFPIRTKSYITLQQRKQHRICLTTLPQARKPDRLDILRLTVLLCFTSKWRISKASRSMQQLVWTGRLKEKEKKINRAMAS